MVSLLQDRLTGVTSHTVLMSAIVRGYLVTFSFEDFMRDSDLVAQRHIPEGYIIMDLQAENVSWVLVLGGGTRSAKPTFER
jgi:hypothetical protein